MPLGRGTCRAAMPTCCQLRTEERVPIMAQLLTGLLLKAGLSFVRTGTGKTTKYPGPMVLLGMGSWNEGVMGLIGFVSPQCQQAVQRRAPDIQQARQRHSANVIWVSTIFRTLCKGVQRWIESPVSGSQSGSDGRASDSWSQRREFKSHVGCRDYLSNKLKERKPSLSLISPYSLTSIWNAK